MTINENRKMLIRYYQMTAVMEAFDLPQRGRRLLIFLLLPEEGVQYSLVFIKRFLERSEVVWF